MRTARSGALARAICIIACQPAVLLAAGCAASTSAPGRAPLVALEPPRESIDSLLHAVRGEYRVPALAAAVVRGEGIVASGAVGARVQDGGAAVTLGDRFHLGSITKPMTATLIAMLVEDGRLRWDATPAGVFPELRGAMHPALAGVTIEQLLSHRAGLPAFTEDAEFGALPPFAGTPAERRRAFTEWLLRRPPAAEPGTEHVYSNAGYTVAAAMAERVTDHPWETLIRDRLFGPLGMTSAGFGWPARVGADEPWGHRSGAQGLVPHPPDDPYRFPIVVAPAGDVHASIEDLARFARLHLLGLTGGGSLLRPSTFAKLHAPIGTYALGWNVQDIGGHPASTHLGSAETFFAVALVAPEEDIAIVAATNAAGEEAQTAVFKALSALLRRYALDPEAPAGH